MGTKSINIKRLNNTLCNIKGVVARYYEGDMSKAELDELLGEVEDFVDNISNSSTFTHMIHKAFKDLKQ